MPSPLRIVIQSDYFIQIVDINSNTEWQQCRSRSVGQQCRSRSVGFFGSQLIWIYTVCKGRVYPGSAGQGLWWMDTLLLKRELFWKESICTQGRHKRFWQNCCLENISSLPNKIIQAKRQVILTYSPPWANSADGKLMIVCFLFF